MLAENLIIVIMIIICFILCELATMFPLYYVSWQQ